MTEIKDRVSRKLEQLDEITTPNQAQAQITILPLTAVHEARYAVQQLKEKYSGEDQMFEVLEPLIRVIGWVEASAYFLDVVTQREAVKTMLSSQQGTSAENSAISRDQ